MNPQRPTTPYELAQIGQLEAWRRAPPGLLARALGVALSPYGWVLTRLVPTAAIEALLRASDWLAEKSMARRPAAELAVEWPLEQVDSEAGRVRNWAMAYACGEGALAGAAGLASLPLDVPALVTLSLRTIRQIGLAYGYAGRGENEKRFIYGVIAIAGANSMPQKAQALDALEAVETRLLAQHWAVLGQRAAERTVRAETFLLLLRDLAEQLGLNLSRRKVLAAVPVVGAAIGAGVNAWYMHDVCDAAQHAYQHRWLKDRGLIAP